MGNKREATGFCLAVVLTMAALSSAFATPNGMPTGARTTQPIGHYEFCRTYSKECSVRTAAPQPVELTRALWADLVDVNRAVNLAVAPKTDQELWGREEVWSYPGRSGDCEDYVLEKRRVLIGKGVPATDLLITVVRQSNGAGHAVLTVRTNLGDFILDNLEPRVLVWTATDYQYLKRQSERNSGQWVAIEDDRQLAVGSIR